MQRWLLAFVCLSVFGCSPAEDLDGTKPLSLSDLNKLQGLTSSVNQTLSSTLQNEFVVQADQRKISNEVQEATKLCQHPIEGDGSQKVTRKVTGSCPFNGSMTFTATSQFNENIDGKIEVNDVRLRQRLGIASIGVAGTRTITRRTEHSELTLTVTLSNGQNTVIKTVYDGYAGTDVHSRYTFESQHDGRVVKASHKEGDRFGYINTKGFEELDFNRYVPVLR